MDSNAKADNRSVMNVEISETVGFEVGQTGGLIASFNEALSHLEERLSVILSPAHPVSVAEQPDKETRLNRSQLYTQLYEQNMAISNIINRLSAMIDRINL